MVVLNLFSNGVGVLSIRQLEQHLGTRWFRREGRSIRLSTEGRTLLIHANLSATERSPLRSPIVFVGAGGG
jgi:hypothetical protein